jgi:hypothetical protein
MGRLLIVELRRALSRGVTRGLLALGVAGVVLAGVLTFAFTTDVAAQRAERQALYERRVEACMTGQSRRGLPAPPDAPGRPASPPAPGAPPPSAGALSDQRASCEDAFADLADSVDEAGFHLTDLWPGWDPHREGFTEFFDLLDAVVMLPALLLMLGAVVAGASMVGAEWQAGSFVTLLTWEPRRARLLAARMIASAVLGFVIAVTLLALFTVVLLPTQAVKGGAAGPSGEWWTTYVGVVLRLGALTGLAAAAGAALAMIGKRTALAVFALFGYLIAGELILRSLWSAARPWLLLRNVGLVLAGEDLVPDGSRTTGTLVVLAYAGIVIAAALVMFARRDFASSS